MCGPLNICFGRPLFRFLIGLGQVGIMARFRQGLGLGGIPYRPKPIPNWTEFHIGLRRIHLYWALSGKGILMDKVSLEWNICVLPVCVVFCL